MCIVHILPVFLIFSLYSNWFDEQKTFPVKPDPVDVVIACHEKDIVILPLCIKNVRLYVKNVRRVIVVSEKQFTQEAEWFDESCMPFSKKSIAEEFSSIDPNFKQDQAKIKRVGWYFKQIMNFYAAFVIPEISSNLLILDADTVFLKPVDFVDENGIMLHAPGTEYYPAYFAHMQRFLPGLKKVFEQHSGISHHMLFQRSILEDLFNLVESHHKIEFWRAYCRCVDVKEIGFSGAADYEIYFNFVLMRTNQIKLRPLEWANITKRSEIIPHQDKGYAFVSWHSYSRQDE